MNIGSLKILRRPHLGNLGLAVVLLGAGALYESRLRDTVNGLDWYWVMIWVFVAANVVFAFVSNRTSLDADVELEYGDTVYLSSQDVLVEDETRPGRLIVADKRAVEGRLASEASKARSEELLAKLGEVTR